MQPKRTMCGFGLQGSFGRNILESLVYYLMPNKCKNLKDMKSSSGAPNVNFRKMSVRKTISDLEFSEHLL